MADEKKIKKLDQKIFFISDNLEIEKSKQDKHYKFYKFEDLLFLIKPMLKDLDLLLRFTQGKIENNIYTLEIELIDLKTGETFKDYDSQLIDVNPTIMSLPQSVNVSKTFLKKNLLNNLFNIKEPEPENDPKIKKDQITNTDIKRFYAVFTKKFSKNVLETKIKSLINQAYNVKDKRNISRDNFISLIKYADNNNPDNIENALKQKIEQKKS